MSNFDSLNEALDVDYEETKREPIVHDLVHLPDEESIDKKDDSTTERERDYQYARANLYSLIEKGQEAVNGALELAQEGDSARCYEVAINGVKSMSEVAEKLLDLQKKVKDLDAESVNNNQLNVTNNSVFFGSTSELQKMIKEGLKLPEER